MEIKCKGLRIDGKGWAYGNYIKMTYMDKLNKENILFEKHYIGTTNDAKLFDNIFMQVDVNPETVGMYSTVKDSYDNEIFSGDLLSVCSAKDEITNSVYECRFENGGFFLYTKHLPKINGEYIRWGAISSLHEKLNKIGVKIKVIGNIHEK